MKNFKSISAIVLVVTIILGMFSGINAFAASVSRGDRLWVDVVEAETTSIRFKVKQTNPDETYCIELMSPNDINKPHDVVASTVATPNGMFRTYGPTEELLYMYAGGWVEEDEQNAKIVSDFTMNEEHDIIVKLDGTIYDGISHLYISRLYVDGNYCGSFIRQNNNPISAINVYGYGGDVSGIETEYISAVGARQGYMNAVVSGIDFDKKLLTLDFSETPASYDFAGKTVLKATNIANGEKNIPLTLVSTDNTRLVFSYTGELDNSSECMVVFPDGIKSALVENEDDEPRKMYSNVITFDANKDVPGTSGNGANYCDYNDIKATMWVNQPAGTSMDTILTVEEDDETNISHVYYNAGTTWFNGHMRSTDGEITAISMDVKPLINGLNTTMEFMLPGQAITPLNIVFGSDGYVLALYSWAQSNAVTNSYPFDHQNLYWLNAGHIGEYEAGKWVNIKLEHNKTTKTIDVYFNGSKKLTLGLVSNSTHLGDIRIRDLGSGTEAGTPVMRFDNIKITKRMPCVSQVRFTDFENNVLLPFGKIKSGLSKVEMSFNQSINTETLAGNVKLVQDGKELKATGTFDSANGVYTLILEDSVMSDMEIELMVNGVQNIGGESINYKTYVNSYDGRIEPFIRVVDADGMDVEVLTKDTKAYVNGGIENFSSKDTTAQIMIAQYEGQRLVDVYVHPKFTAEKNNFNGVFFDDENPVGVKLDARADSVKVFMWKDLNTMTPWIENIYLPVE